MTIMSDAALRRAIETGDIRLDPSPEDIRAASIDLRLGPEAFLGSGEEIIRLEERRLLAIPPGEMAIVSTLEKVAIGARYAGQIGLRSAHARRGLALLAGPQVDPGFSGRLHVVLVNLSPVEITLSHREPLIKVVFHDLGEDVQRPYGSDVRDEYQEQDQITGPEIDDIRQHRGYAMSEVIRDMQTIATNVSELRKSVDGYISRTDLYLKIFVGSIFSLVATLIGVAIALAAQS
jgi:dCTP deaminase